MKPLRNKSYAAYCADCSTQQLDRYIAAGTGPRVTRLGRRVLFTDEALDEWLKARAV